LLELRQTISRACGFTRNNSHSPSPLISPVSSSSSEYYPCLEGEDTVPDRLDVPEDSRETGQIEADRNEEDGDVRERDGIELNALPTNKPVHSPWDVEFNNDTKIGLHLDLVHKLPQEGVGFVAFSMDGKYLATASSLGIVTIFDSKTGKRIR
jgi:WD40 repeat protein